MKIDFISSSLDGGGAERVAVLLANFFVTNGHQVSIITFNKGDAYQIDENIKRVRLHSGSIKNHTVRSLWNLTLYYKVKRNRPDIVISSICTMNFVSILVCKLFSIKIIASEHHNHLRKVYRITKFTWNHLYRYANTITVLTNFDKSFFEEKGAKVVVMPNPCTFIPIEDIPSVRKKVILAVGSLNRYHDKGFDNLVRLIVPVLQRYPEWTLKIVGGGDEGMTLLKELTFQGGLDQQVIFSGFRNDVKDIMRESEIFILPSRCEGLPMVLLEAMSQGMTCISYNCITGPSEMIIDNENGLLIEDQNIEAMQEGLIKLICDEELRKTIAKNALQSLDRYSIENVSQLWGKLIREIVS